jgi:hypothetical protein
MFVVLSAQTKPSLGRSFIQVNDSSHGTKRQFFQWPVAIYSHLLTVSLFYPPAGNRELESILSSITANAECAVPMAQSFFFCKPELFLGDDGETQSPPKLNIRQKHEMLRYSMYSTCTVQLKSTWGQDPDFSSGVSSLLIQDTPNPHYSNRQTRHWLLRPAVFSRLFNDSRHWAEDDHFIGIQPTWKTNVIYYYYCTPLWYTKTCTTFFPRVC